VRKLRPILIFVLLLVAGERLFGQTIAVEAVGFTVQDMDRSLDFFTRVLMFEKVSDQEVAGEEYEHLSGVFGMRARVVRLRLGEEAVELTEYLAPQGRHIPADIRPNDRVFQHIAIIVSDMDKAYAWLRQNKVRHASTGPQTIPEWNQGAAGIRAFYFRDPDGHFLEILSFPPGKGQARWQDKSRLFLGIDHTAIVVSDTEASLRFYRDLLGLRVAGESENHGTEQEHLNNVFGARLRITAVRGASGPGIEFLEYLAPGDGRPAPVDLKANDLLYWQTTMVVGALDRMAADIRRARAPMLSSGVVRAGPSRALIVRDPDGHAMKLTQ
jgi:catechol 2,3-dioxygenase-like lactoylglutathione lyase family enzyme